MSYCSSAIANHDAERQLIDNIIQSGISAPDSIIFDSNIHRFDSCEGGKKTGWYVAHSGKIYAAAFGCWKTGLTQTWRQDLGRRLSDDELKEHAAMVEKAKNKARLERERDHSEAAKEAKYIWGIAENARSEHPYLMKKLVKNYGLKELSDGRLIVPIYNSDSALISLQYISVSGEKRFHSRASTRSGRYKITGTGSTVYIAEGYATAASIHECTGATVYVAFSASQLTSVAESVRENYNGDLIIVADNDESGVGLREAKKAAKAAGGRVIEIPIMGMDANDYAREHDLKALLDGYSELVDDSVIMSINDSNDIDSSGVDLLMPPGLAGELTRWINDQCRFPRERLAVGAALSALSTIGGLRYIDDDYNICSNLFFFNVAGASSGKDSVLAAQAKLLRQAGMAPAVHGAIKSEQEITRNLVAHQLACYIVDEVGTVLQKITNASKRGGAAYLEGVVGLLMAAFTKSNDTLLISGDLRRDVRKELSSQIKQLEKSENAHADSMIESLEKQLNGLENGLENPFLSLSGYTTPETFSSFVNFENTTNGFLARALIIQERETNPMFKPRFKPTDMPLYIKSAIAGLVSDRTEPFAAGRIEQTGDRIGVKSTPEAIDLLENIALSFHQMAEDAKALGLESVPRRGFEQVLKLSLTLSFGNPERTAEHVKWAYAYVHGNVKEKMALIASNVAKNEKRHDEHLMMSILNMLDPVEPVTLGVIVNRNRSYKKEDVQNALNILISNDAIVELDHVPARGKATKKYVLNK